MRTKAAIITALLLAPALIPGEAKASTLKTFTFTQTGYPVNDILTGTFTGTVEADGSIQQADLTGFTASYAANLGRFGIQMDTYTLPNLQLFSFIPSIDGPNSSLDIFASVTSGPPGSVCVGAAAAFGLCGVSGNLAGVDHLRYPQNPFLWTTTTQFALVQLVPAQPAATPEPATAGLCALALASAFVWRRKRLATRGKSDTL
ncbi:MAG TPA: PEP-CTERM sorting domain-containing protein [Bryobacteraceae bacterium]|nr:PEP-CTERM sorting domain-containing protein [Bryobacteraceae bacterium]